MNDTTNETYPLQFLQEKIGDIRSALFFSQNNDVIKMPTSIITVLRVDDEGHIWFFVKKPLQYLDAFEKEFAARLDFFRKGKNFFLQVLGRAFIVDPNDPAIEELAAVSDTVKTGAMAELVMMKVKITHAECYDNSVPENKYWWNDFTQKIQRWFLSARLGYKPYNLRPARFGDPDFGLKQAS